MKPIIHPRLVSLLLLATTCVSHADLIFSWENGLEGWSNNGVAGASVAASPTGATEGVQSMAVQTPMNAMWYVVPAKVDLDPTALQATFTGATELKLDICFPDPGFYTGDGTWQSPPTVEIIILGESVNYLGLGERTVVVGSTPQTFSWALTVGQAAAMASGTWGQILLKFTYGNSGASSTHAVFYVDRLATTVASDPPPVSNIFWKGGLNNNWAALNWTSDDAGNVPGGLLPTNGSAAVAFSATGATNEMTVLGANQHVESVVIRDGAGPVDIGGSHRLSVGAGGIWQSETAESLLINTTGGVVLTEDQVWRNLSHHEMLVSSQLSGSGTLTKGGIGGLYLENSNLHSGGTIIEQGVLTLGHVNALGPATATLDMNGGSLDLNGFSPTLGGISGSSGAVIMNSSATPSLLTVDDAADGTFTCSINDGFGEGGVSVVKRGSGILTVNGVGNFTGPLTIEEGQYTANAAIYGTPTSTSFGSGQTAGRKITVRSPGSALLSNNNIFGNAAGDLALLPEVILDGSLMSTSRYNLIGDITLQDGELNNYSSDDGNYMAYQFKGRVKVMGTMTSYITGTKGNHLSENTLFDVANVTGDEYEDLHISSPLVNQSGDFGLAPGGLTKTGNGTLLLQGANTYSGNTHVSQGELIISSPSLSNIGLLEVAAGARINLDFVGTDLVGSLKLGSDQKAPGVYGAAGSGAPIESALITGTGFIEVAVTDPYASWIADFPSLTGNDTQRGADPDADGLTNIQEFAFNSMPDQTAPSSKIRSGMATISTERVLVITLPVRDGAVFSGGAPATATLSDEQITYQIQGSDNLTIYDQGVSEVTADTTGFPDLDDGWTYRSFRLDGNIGGVSPRGPRGFLRTAIIDTH